MKRRIEKATIAAVAFFYGMGEFMKEWLFHQFETFNVLLLIVILIIQLFMAKANTQKMLKEQSQELYNELEEIKDEIRGNNKK